MNILFLDQSGKLGGAELALLDIACSYRDRCLVGLFEDGPFRETLKNHQILVQVLAKDTLQVRKDSGILQSLGSIQQLIPLLARVTALSRKHDLIYANTPKALVVGAIASWVSRRPLVYHLHDIISSEHFSASNRQIMILLANRFVSLVIANSQASQTAFIAAGGRSDLVHVVYNGFEPAYYQNLETCVQQLRQQLNLADRFVVGHFSRLSPWKGQHILIEALTHCPEDVTALLVGDALFGEQAYVSQLYQQVADLGLEDRVRFLGFRSDVPSLMAACDLVAHTSTAPEPFGRVIVEAMMCGKPVIAAAAGGAVELVEHGQTGWLVPPGDPVKLADMICHCRSQPALAQEIADRACFTAKQQFNLSTTNQQIAKLLCHVGDNQ